jgi:pyruvate dehydrogenase E1 component alpha subunit
MYDPDLYRTKDEIAVWKQRDPIRLLRARLEAEGLLSAETLGQLEAEAEAEVAGAVAEADAGPLEPVTDLLRDVCASAAT